MHGGKNFYKNACNKQINSNHVTIKSWPKCVDKMCVL